MSFSWFVGADSRSGLRLEDIQQSGNDLTAEEEADLIDNGWK